MLQYLVGLLLLLLALGGLPDRADARESGTRVRAVLDTLPLHFEANRGQVDPRVDFVVRGAGHTLFLTRSEFVLVSPVAGPDAERRAGTSVVSMTFVGANPTPRVTGRAELPGKAHYLKGSDPARWRTDVPTYARVHYAALYPGVDLVAHGTKGRLEYDFVVAPGADPQTITLDFQGVDRVEVDSGGDLVLHTRAGLLRQSRPVIYQEVGGIRREVAGGYVVKAARRVGFRVAAYDASQPLVIDPVLFYSTFLGGKSTDAGIDIAVDAAGNAYVAGVTGSLDFPTTTGAFDTTYNGGARDAFVTKLNPAGSGLVYSTYLGGSGFEFETAFGIVVDAAGHAYVTGFTNSSNFPVTPGAFQTTLGGNNDAFVTKLNPAGSGLVYSTYLGGPGFEHGRAIAIDAAVTPT